MPERAFDRRKTQVKVSDDRLTPLEIAELLESDREMPFAIAPLLKGGESPAAYGREAWSEDASYYTSGNGAGRLIVAFTHPGGRLGVPISSFLQILRDDVYDVILLRDASELQYTHGIQGLGTFLETMRRIEDFANSKGFQQIITFGSSMGGYPALRGGRLLKARRAISVGGRYAWHPGRLMRNERSVQAFDLLCACASPSTTELVGVYSYRHEQDKGAFDLLQETFPECSGVPIDTDQHNIAGYFYKAGLLPLFLACLFDYWDEVEIRTDLLGRVEQAARHSLIWGALRDERALRATRAKIDRRHTRIREWLQGTPLRSVIRPIRALRRVLRDWSGSPKR